MIKKFFLASSLFFASQYASAQSDISYGIKAGLNVSSIVGDATDNLNMKTGIHAGGFVEFGINEHFSIQPEVIFSTQGAKYERDSDLDGTNEDICDRLNYINIPILAKIDVLDGLSAQIGPQLGILASAKTKLGDNDSTDIKDDLKSTDIGLAIGLGYEIEEGVTFDARYNMGITDIAKSDAIDQRNSTIQFSVGYKF